MKIKNVKVKGENQNLRLTEDNELFDDFWRENEWNKKLNKGNNKKNTKNKRGNAKPFNPYNLYKGSLKNEKETNPYINHNKDGMQLKQYNNHLLSNINVNNHHNSFKDLNEI
jgi:hypothetical protein